MQEGVCVCVCVEQVEMWQKEGVVFPQLANDPQSMCGCFEELSY